MTLNIVLTTTAVSLSVAGFVLVSLFVSKVGVSNSAKAAAKPSKESEACLAGNSALLHQKRMMEIRRCNPSKNGILTGMTVLAADDDPTNLEVLIAMLEFMGLSEIVVARNGQEAVDFAAEKKFDIIYMDIQMPLLTGIDAAKKIQKGKLNQETPIIPITGFSRIVSAELCSAAGMIGFLEKPVKLELLGQTTRQALRSRFANMPLYA